VFLCFFCFSYFRVFAHTLEITYATYVVLYIPRCRRATWICMCGHTRDLVIYSKFHRNQFRGFGAPGPILIPWPRGSKFGLSHYFGYSLLQQLVLPYKPWLVYSTSPDSASTVIASDKSSVSTNRKSTTRFPTSHRRSMYVTPKSPKGWLKTRIFTFFALPSHLRCR